MRPFTWLAIVVSMAPLSACSELDVIDAGVCGNGILEKGEDCDSPDESCGQPGDDDECRFVAVGGVCPVGAAPGLDDVCRFPSGTYEVTSTLSVGPNTLAGVGDFDGDDMADVVSVLPGQVSVFFMNENGEPLGTDSTPSVLTRPAVGSLTDDGLASMVLASGGVSVLLGQSERALVPKSYAPFPVAEDAQYVFGDFVPYIPGEEVFELSTDNDGKLTLKEVYLFSGLLEKKPLDGIGGQYQLSKARINNQIPCDAVVISPTGKNAVVVYPMCEWGTAVWLDGKPLLDDNGQPVKTWVYSAKAVSFSVSLPAGLIVSGSLLVHDMNGDGLPDLVVHGSSGKLIDSRLLVAYGTGNDHFSSSATDPVNNVDDTFAPFIASPAMLLNANTPLALGDLNADGVVDFVTPPLSYDVDDKGSIAQLPGAVLVSDPASDLGACDLSSLPSALAAQALFVPGYRCVRRGRWTSAAIANFNADSLPDVAATAGELPKIDFFLNNGGSIYTSFNPFQIPTLGVAERLQVGDFDGDLVNDLLFVEASSTVGVAFGRPVGAPEDVYRIPDLGTVDAVATGNLVSIPFDFDQVTDLGVVATSSSGRTAALLYGSTNRFIRAPFQVFNANREYESAGRALVGRFTDDDHRDLALITTGPELYGMTSLTLANQLWLAPSTGDADLSTSSMKPGEDLAGFFPCGAEMAAGDLDHDGRDEVVMLGPIGSLENPDMGLRVAKAGADGFQIVQSAPLSGIYASASGFAQCLGEGALSLIQQGAEGVDLLRFQDTPLLVDMDGDRGDAERPDVLALSFGDVGTVVSILRTSESGSVDAQSPLSVDLPPELSGPAITGFAALNADSSPDKELVVTTAVVLPGQLIAGPVYLLKVDLTTGESRLLNELKDAAGATGVMAADINHDGVDDLVFSNDGGLAILLGKEPVR